MDLNPYKPSSIKSEPVPAKPWIGAPSWRLVAISFFLGAAMNIGGWFLAHEDIRAPRRYLFAPVVLLGLQDMSDLFLGAVAGGVLSAGYAGTLTLAKNSSSRSLGCIVIIMFHVACVAAVESHAPLYTF